MNEGQFSAFRDYLAQIASDQRQLIKVQERTNELLNEIRLGVNRTDGRLKEMDALPVTNEGAKAKAVPVGPVTVETVKAEPLKTTETVEVKDATNVGVRPDPFIEAVTQRVDTKSAAAKPAAKKDK